MRRWVESLLALMLTFVPARAADLETRPIVLHVQPHGAVVSRLAETRVLLGLADGPVLVPVSTTGSMPIDLVIEKAGFHPARVRIQSADVRATDPYVYPQLIQLEPEGWDAALELAWSDHPILCVLALVSGVGILALVLDWRRRLARAAQLEALMKRTEVRDPRLGRTIGRYVTVERLGGGGSADVFRAVPSDCLSADASVAIKVLRAAATPAFRREVRICMKLQHPGMVRLLDWGEESTPYLVMELIEGTTLRHHITPGGLPERQALALLRPAFEAVAYAHESGIVHRDLKPDNLMVRPDGQVVVMDFGIGQLEDAQTAQAVGTIGYLAPEVLAGQGASPASDQYALGVVLHELLTGELPGSGKALPASPILRRMLSPDPAARFASIRDLVNCLDS